MSSNNLGIPENAAREKNSNEPATCKRFREASPDHEYAPTLPTKAKTLNVRETARIDAFYAAVEENDVERMAFLLKCGVDVNDRSVKSATPIFYAASKEIGADGFEYLMENGADLRVKESIFGYTLLHAVVHCGDAKKFELLMEKHVDVNARDDNDVTPLHLAAMAGNVDMAKKLIARGADVDCATRDSKLKPLHLVSMPYDSSSVHCNFKNDLRFSGTVYETWNKDVHHRDPVPLIECLIEAGADVNARDAFENTALHFAALECNKDATESLLKFGAYVDVANAEGELPLHNALRSFNAEGLTSLLEHGADINDIGRQFANIQEYESSRVNNFCNNVLEHTNKLRAANLPVADVYKSHFHRSFWESHRAECLREVERLREHSVDDKVSLYDFLHMNVGRRRAYVQRVPLDLEMTFPKYYGIVYGSCRQAVVRRSLIELSKTVWEDLTEVELPDVCLEGIFSYLRNTELTFFLAGVV